MDKHIAIIKDVVRNVPHAIVIKSEDSIICKSLTTFGQSIIDSCFIDGTINDEKIPTGFSSTGFHHVTPSMEEIIGSSFNTGEKSAYTGNVNTPQRLDKTQKFLGRKILSKPKILGGESIVDVNIVKFRTRKTHSIVVNFKASMFKKSINKKIIISEIKSKSLSFNPISNTIIGKKSIPSAVVIAEKLTSEYGHGAIRRAMKSKTLSRSFTGSRRLSRKADILISISSEKIDKNKQSSRFITAGGI